MTEFPCENIAVNAAGHLTFAGQDTTELARQYQTPLYLMDEDRLRENCRMYREALRESCGENARALFASKACSFGEMYRIVADEGLGIDVVSCGEIANPVSTTAAAAARATDFFHKPFLFIKPPSMCPF